VGRVGEVSEGVEVGESGWRWRSGRRKDGGEWGRVERLEGRR